MAWVDGEGEWMWRQKLTQSFAGHFPAKISEQEKCIAGRRRNVCLTLLIDRV